MMTLNLILKALSHPIRRDIISRLRDGAMSAGDLAASYGVSKPTMSSHFNVLKEADLIRAERDGVTIHYHLNVTVAEETLAIIMSLLGTHTHDSVEVDIDNRKKIT